MHIIMMTLVSLFLVSCNYSVDKKLGTAQLDQAIEKLPANTIVNYKLINSAIIAPKCLSCHSSSGGDAGGINLESYANLKNAINSVRDEVTSGRMPKNRAPLNSKEKDLLLEWIEGGALAEGASNSLPETQTLPIPNPAQPPVPPLPPGEVMPLPKEINYKLVNERVIAPRCLGCHSDKNGNRGGVNLENYENVFEQLESIKDEVSSGSMPRPKNKPLTDIQKKIFLSWIESGGPQNLEE